jgi:hypothetical protein
MSNLRHYPADDSSVNHENQALKGLNDEGLAAGRLIALVIPIPGENSNEILREVNTESGRSITSSHQQVTAHQFASA